MSPETQLCDHLEREKCATRWWLLWWKSWWFLDESVIIIIWNTWYRLIISIQDNVSARTLKQCFLAIGRFVLWILPVESVVRSQMSIRTWSIIVTLNVIKSHYFVKCFLKSGYLCSCWNYCFFSSKNQVLSLPWGALVVSLRGTLKPYFTKE